MKIDRKKRQAGASVENARPTEHPGLHSWLSSLWNVLFQAVALFTYKIVVQSRGELPKDGSVLILAKHQQLPDVPLGKLAVTRDGGRHLWCLMKDEMARGPFAPIYLRVGGIPVDRANPEKSKHDLLHARKVLHSGEMLCIFPEQTFYPGKMGRGKTPGFRFITGKPPEPIAVVCVGFRYTRRRFRRTLVEINIGGRTDYGKADDPEVFLDERMREIAELSGLEYTFPRPAGRQGRRLAESATD